MKTPASLRIEKTDVIIVGAGAAGSLLAAKLAQAGRRVVVLEAGPGWTSSDLYSSQIWARRLKWGGPPVLPGGQNPIGYNMASGSGFGGAALHHYGGWPRLHAEDFRLKSLYGRGRDWPIGYDDLRPYYDRIQDEVGLSGDAVAEIWRPPGKAYPLPPLPVFKQGEILARGFHALGMKTAPYPTAILSAPYKGRPACLYDGWCDAGCPIMALANPLAIYVPQAQAAGAQFRSFSTVARVITEQQGAHTTRTTRAIGVEYFDATGAQQIIYAPLVILASAAVQNARLLLNSATSKLPEGLANSSGLVGKAITAHALAQLYGLFEEETDCHLGTSGAQLTCQDGYGKIEGDRTLKVPKPFKPSKPFGSTMWAIANAMKPNDLLGIANTRPDIMGRELHKFMLRGAKHMAVLGALCESIPEDSNRVELASEKDRFGLPLPRLNHTMSEEAMALWAYNIELGKNIYKAAGSREYWSAPPVFAHLAGGTLMGKEAATSVTDSYGRCHDVPNMVIAGASLFPSAGAVNPTYTIHALSLRTAEHLISERGIH